MKRNKIIGLVFCIAFILSLIYDKQIVLFVIKLRHPIVDDIMLWISHYATGFIVLIVMTTLFMWGERKKEWIPVLWMSVLVSMLVSTLLKSGFGRVRPFIALNFEPLTTPNASSFPSGHATTAFAAVPVLDREFRLFQWFWILIAGLISISRLYLGVHYLSDILFGALLGYLIGEAFIYLEEKYRFVEKVFSYVKKQI